MKIYRFRRNPVQSVIPSILYQRAFSIIEFAIVLVIFALLVGIIGPAMLKMADSAKADAAGSDIQEIAEAIDDYFEDNGKYPDSLADIFSPVPTDPWGNPYQYVKIQGAIPTPVGSLRKDKNLVPINSDYDLYSYGADGKSAAPLTAAISKDDVVRGRDGNYFGYASDY